MNEEWMNEYGVPPPPMQVWTSERPQGWRSSLLWEFCMFSSNNCLMSDSCKGLQTPVSAGSAHFFVAIWSVQLTPYSLVCPVTAGLLSVMWVSTAHWHLRTFGGNLFPLSSMTSSFLSFWSQFPVSSIGNSVPSIRIEIPHWLFPTLHWIPGLEHFVVIPPLLPLLLSFLPYFLQIA